MPSVPIENRRCVLTKILTWAALAALLCFGCSVNPHASRYAKTKPQSQAMTGNWILEDKNASGQAVETTTILLERDGTFSSANYPGIALYGIGELGKSYSGQGSWALERLQSYWILRLSWSRLVDRSVDYGAVLYIVGDTSPYLLETTIGDPDEGQALVFTKETSRLSRN